MARNDPLPRIPRYGKRIHRRLGPLLRALDEEHKIKQILSWTYKFEGLEQIPTKTSVTKIKEQDLWNEEEKTKLKINQAFEEIPNSDEEKEGKVSTSITAKPKFLNEEARTKISNAEKGTLMHLCVQKMDETQEYDLHTI